MSRYLDAGTTDLMRGYLRDDQLWCCLFCSSTFEEGVIVSHREQLLTAERAAAQHVDEAHGGAFHALLGLGASAHGLTDVQHTVLARSWDGATDAEVGEALGGRSTSTVRNHRFQLRKRHKQAQLFHAIMSLSEARTQDPVLRYHSALPVRDDRADVTASEAQEILHKYMGEHDTLTRFPKKEKHKLVVLRHLSERFEPGRRYTEPQVNAQLVTAYDDYVTLRRYLIEYRFLEREPDGAAYWRP